MPFYPLKLHILSASPWYVINIHILTTDTPFSYKDIISHSSYIYCWKKLNYCDFIAAPAPKWFLVISHHFSCSAEVILWNSECFLLFLTAWHQNKLCWSYTSTSTSTYLVPIALCLITNLNLLACQTLLWSPYLASHQMSRIFVNCVNFYTSSESLNLSSWLASCPSHSETCFSSNFKSNTQQRSKKIFLN